jgi:hypothetical protein
MTLLLEITTFPTCSYSTCADPCEERLWKLKPAGIVNWSVGARRLPFHTRLFLQIRTAVGQFLCWRSPDVTVCCHVWRNIERRSEFCSVYLVSVWPHIMSTLSRVSVACLAVPHFFSHKRQDISLRVKCLYFSSLDQTWREILVKIPNKSIRKSIPWQQGYFLRGNRGRGRHGEAISRIWRCFANA